MITRESYSLAWRCIFSPVHLHKSFVPAIPHLFLCFIFVTVKCSWSFFVLTTLLIIFIYNRSNNNNMATKRVIMSTSTWHGDLDARYIFEPVTIESLGVFTASARHLLSWKEDLWKLGRELPVPKDLDFGAALRCCPSAWQFAGYRLHRLMSVRLSRAGIVSKRRKLAAWFLHHLIAPRL